MKLSSLIINLKRNFYFQKISSGLTHSNFSPHLGTNFNEGGKHGGTLVCHLIQDLKVPFQTLIKTKNLLNFI